MKKKESILKRADGIINNRSEEKERQYGPFHYAFHINVNYLHDDSMNQVLNLDILFLIHYTLIAEITPI